jgi:hypothetical protein
MFWAEIGDKQPNFSQIALYSDHRLVEFETVLVNSTVLVQYDTA